jgi:hypothetical protein
MKRFMWARLNADTLFLALLAIFAGALDIYRVQANVVVLIHPEEGPLAIARASCFVLGGLLMLYSLLSGRVNWEVLGRCILIGAVTFQVWRRWIEFGFSDTRTEESLITLLILLFTAWLRITGLFSKDGLSVFLPPKGMTQSEVDDATTMGPDAQPGETVP